MKRWLKAGCLGCLGVLGLLILIAAGIVSTAWFRAQREKITDQVLTPDVPRAREESLPLPGRGMSRGKVVLHLAHAERFTIASGSSGEALRVEATYDANAYELQEAFKTPADAAWTYRLDFRRKGGWIGAAIKEALSGSRPNVNIVLPRDVPIDLELHLREGGLNARLSGLRLYSAELDVAKGGLELSFDEPLAAPMERFVLHGEMGGFSLASLGNASPRQVEIDCSMGGIEVDLRGKWLQDSAISIHSRMAGGHVRLPRDVIVKGVPTGHLDIADAERAKLPVLTLSVSAAMGELEIEE